MFILKKILIEAYRHPSVVINWDDFPCLYNCCWNCSRCLSVKLPRTHIYSYTVIQGKGVTNDDDGGCQCFCRDISYLLYTVHIFTHHVTWCLRTLHISERRFPYTHLATFYDCWGSPPQAVRPHNAWGWGRGGGMRVGGDKGSPSSHCIPAKPNPNRTMGNISGMTFHCARFFLLFSLIKRRHVLEN